MPVTENGAKKCANCDATEYTTAIYEANGDGMMTLDRYELPDDVDYVCRDCGAELNTHTPEDMSDDELIAAIMDESIGYASPQHAERHVEDWRNREEIRADDDQRLGCWCERGRAVFDGSLEDLIERARAHWLTLSDEKQDKLLDVVENWRKIEEEEGAGTSMGISCSYPSMGI